VPKAAGSMVGVQRHLDVSRIRYLPAVTGHGFELAPGEPLGSGLRRLGVEQAEQALRGLAGEADDIDHAVHEARKAMKRLRSILRLVRSEIGERAYKYENRSLRDAARLLAGVRDGAVAVETVTDLAGRFEGSLPVDVFDDLAERLDRRALQMRHRVLFESDAVDQVASTLERTRVRFAAWPVETGERAVYGRPIEDRFGSIRSGLGATYGRGRTEMKRAYTRPTATNFHLWRKRVKYLRHQMEILNPLWPEVVGGTAIVLDELGHLLGEEHDLAALLGLLAVDQQLCPDPVERSLFAALAQHRRSELQAVARVLGMRVYTEKPERFVSRMGAYWESTRLSLEVGFEVE
jgi:CHAD domain-containing protein